MSSDVVAQFAHLHADARAVLAAWTAPDTEQEALRTAYLAHLDAHPDGVAKAGPPAHLTASCIVLDATGEHVLLTHHRKADAWFQLGGHCEAGDASLWDAARREANEESGLGIIPLRDPVQLDRHVLVGAFGTCVEHLDVRYAAVLAERVTPVASEESLDVRWFPVTDLPRSSGEELGSLIAAALRVTGPAALRLT